MLNNRTLQRRILAATSISYIVVLLDASIVNVALAHIATSFSTDIAGLQWVVSAYTLSFASLLLTGGALGDRLVARDVYLAGLALFTLASALCGIAPSLIVLVGARTLQGIGAAMLVPCSLKLIHHACPDARERASAIGIWVGCGGVAMAAGPLIGGVLIHAFGWRSIFFASVPAGLIGMSLTYHIARDETSPHMRHLDLAGQVTAMLALGTLIAVLIEGPHLGWQSMPVLTGFAISVSAAFAFLMIENQRSEPMFPLSFFRNDIFTASTVVSMASAFVFYGLLFVFSLYYQQVRGYSPLQAGLAFLPMTAMVAIGSMTSHRLVQAIGSRGSMCMAFGAYAVGSLGMWSCTATSPYWAAVLPLLAIGLASGFVSPAATAPAMGTVAGGQAGIAAAVLNSARQTGAALGVAIFGALIATLHPFVRGMHAALWGSVAISIMALFVWWFALIQKRTSAELVPHDAA